MTNIYYAPEKFGLRTIGEVEWSDGCYQFDTTVLWQDVETGAFYYGDDSGCSCPSPFESDDRTTITKVERLQDLLNHLDERKAESYRYGDEEWQADVRAELDGECSALITKYLDAKKVAS